MMQRALTESDLHIWRCDLGHWTAVAPQIYLAVLSKTEQERYARYRTDELKKKFLLTKTFQRWVLSHYANVTLGDWQFDTAKHGKPYILQKLPYPLSFNVSHSGNQVAIAISQHALMGIDIEAINPKRRHGTMDIAEHSFHSKEVSWLSQSSEQTNDFYRQWTLKEAYIKALGLGLHLPLKSYGFWDLHYQQHGQEHLESMTVTLNDTYPPQHWQFKQLRPLPEYMLAVSVHCMHPLNVSTTVCVSIPTEPVLFQQVESAADLSPWSKRRIEQEKT